MDQLELIIIFITSFIVFAAAVITIIMTNSALHVLVCAWMNMQNKFFSLVFST